METNALSLSELNGKVKLVIKSALPDAYWVRAEIAELKENNSGHCYLELVEKGNKEDLIIAKAKAIIWAYSYRLLKAYFYSSTQRELSKGMSVLIKVIVEFHELYGFSLIVKDIDPSYTLGDLAIKKAQIIKQLKEEGVYEMNRELELPLVPQRIAVVSSQTAAGFEDFVTHLSTNQYGYQFRYTLFSATMQGNDTEHSIISALDRIHDYIYQFDVVVIIRGGGASSDLSSFDSYPLAYHITQFPLPILTGIGHEQDDSIVDMVAHTRLKTPTAVADFIVSKFNEFENILQGLQQELAQSGKDILDNQNELLNSIFVSIPQLAKEVLFEQQQLIQQYGSSLKVLLVSILGIHKHSINTFPIIIRSGIQSKFFKDQHHFAMILQNLNSGMYLRLYKEKKKHELLGNTFTLSDPQLIMKKGYSLTFFNHHIVKDASVVKKGDKLETFVYKGVIQSMVEKQK